MRTLFTRPLYQPRGSCNTLLGLAGQRGGQGDTRTGLCPELFRYHFHARSISPGSEIGLSRTI